MEIDRSWEREKGRQRGQTKYVLEDERAVSSITAHTSPAYLLGTFQKMMMKKKKKKKKKE